MPPTLQNIRSSQTSLENHATNHGNLFKNIHKKYKESRNVSLNRLVGHWVARKFKFQSHYFSNYKIQIFGMCIRRVATAMAWRREGKASPRN